jgi:hypothetical protein
MLPLIELLLDEDIHGHLGHLFVRRLNLFNGFFELFDVVQRLVNKSGFILFGTSCIRRQHFLSFI